MNIPMPGRWKAGVVGLSGLLLAACVGVVGGYDGGYGVGYIGGVYEPGGYEYGGWGGGYRVGPTRGGARVGGGRSAPSIPHGGGGGHSGGHR